MLLSNSQKKIKLNLKSNSKKLMSWTTKQTVTNHLNKFKEIFEILICCEK